MCIRLQDSANKTTGQKLKFNLINRPIKADLPQTGICVPQTIHQVEILYFMTTVRDRWGKNAHNPEEYLVALQCGSGVLL